MRLINLCLFFMNMLPSRHECTKHDPNSFPALLLLLRNKFAKPGATSLSGDVVECGETCSIRTTTR